jgi:hypothetical protein
VSAPVPNAATGRQPDDARAAMLIPTYACVTLKK